MIRKATIQDIKSIHKILGDYGNQGAMLSRPLSALYDHVRDFFVYIDPESGKFGGCCALQFCWEDMAEIRSLAVYDEFHGKGVGSKLLNAAMEEAGKFGVDKIFTLTYRPDFFTKFDFSIIDRSDLPLKIWGDCITCVKFPDCDEIAMMKTMSEQ